MLVVQHNKVDRTIVKRALLALRKVTPNVIGAVLNAVDVKTQGLLRLRLLRLAPRREGPAEPRRRAARAAERRESRTGRDRCLARLIGRAWAGAPSPSRSSSRRQRRRPGPSASGRGHGRARARPLSLVERKVELEKKGARWQAAAEGGPLQVGEAIRTGPDAVARLELPWMALTLSPGSTLRFPDAFLLSATLDGGRAARRRARPRSAEARDGRGRGARPGPRGRAPAGPLDARDLPRRPLLGRGDGQGRRAHARTRQRRDGRQARPARPATCSPRRGRACGRRRTRSSWRRRSRSSCAGRAARAELPARAVAGRVRRGPHAARRPRPAVPRSRCPGRAPSAGASRRATRAGSKACPRPTA